MHLNIFVSPSCFIYCRGCYSFSRGEKCDSYVDTKTILNFLDFAHNQNICNVTLCGGDPLTRPDIIYLLQKIKELGFLISMDTVGNALLGDVIINGKTIVKKIDIQTISNLVDKIGIPIDGSTNEIFKKFRQTDIDIVSQQIKICDELHKYNANICINTVVHKQNIQNASALTELINKIEYAKEWQLFQFAPLGKFGYLNRKDFEINKLEYLRFKLKVRKKFVKNKKIKFKSCRKRNHSYMLIDNSGNAWIPKFKKNENKTERELIGNINNSNDWEIICQFIKKKRR